MLPSSSSQIRSIKRTATKTTQIDKRFMFNIRQKITPACQITPDSSSTLGGKADKMQSEFEKLTPKRNDLDFDSSQLV
jgi:hypothetical protein